MNNSSESLLKTMPDFADMLALAEEIKNVSVVKLRTELEIKEMEAKVFQVAMTEEDFKVNGKFPAVSYINETYKHTGITGEIIPKRMMLAEVTSELDMLKRRFSMFEQMLDVWRTLCANERSASL